MTSTPIISTTVSLSRERFNRTWRLESNSSLSQHPRQLILMEPGRPFSDEALASLGELDPMARLGGFKLEERWSSWHRDPFTSKSSGHVSLWRNP
jgi:hypothetical protein